MRKELLLLLALFSVFLAIGCVGDKGESPNTTEVPVTAVNSAIAVVSSSTHKEKAQKFIDFVTEKEGQDILNTYGFVLQS